MSRVALPLLLLLAGAGPARGARPVVAVDEIEATGVALSPTARRSLALFLQARVAALPELRVIPPPQVRAAIARLKRAEVGACEAGQGCALALGEQLAASKVLALRVLGAGEACQVVLTLFDMRTATAEHAATSGAACGEGALAAAVSAAVDELARKLRQAASSAPATRSRTAAAKSAVARVSVYVTSFPTAMPVEVDGEPRGTTPVRLDLARGERHSIAIGGKWPYEKVTRTVLARDWQEVRVKLGLEHVDRLELATTAEWLAFGFGGGVLRAAERALFAATLRVATLRWRYGFWTVAELLAGIEGKHSLLSVGTRGGLPIYLGRSGKHQLLAGLGVSYMAVDTPELAGGRALGLIPGLEYVYLASNGSFQVGVGLNAMLPAAGELADPWPYALLLTLRAGISVTPYLRKLRRERK